MTTLKSHICTAYKKREKITKDSLNFLCELEKNEINKSDYNYKNYDDLVIKIEDKDYEDLLEDEEIKEHIQKIIGKEEIKMDFLIKGIIDRTVFDIMILKIKSNNFGKIIEKIRIFLKIKDKEREKDKSKKLKPESRNINEIIEEIENNQNITSLDLSGKGLTGKDIEKLVKKISKRKIKYLDLDYNNIGPNGVKALAENDTLSSLKLSWNNIGPDGAKALAQNKILRFLDLSFNNIGFDGAKALAENDTIKSLSLGNNNIGSDGAEALAKNNTLRFLELWDNNILDNGAKALSKNNTLRFLDLQENNIGDDGAKDLAENSTLRTLYLFYNNIGDDGAKALAENNTLKHLNLYSNNIGDKGAEALAENDTLKYLDLGSNHNIENPEAIKELCKANNIQLEISK